MKLKSTLLLSIIFMFAFATLGAKGNWNHESSKDGINIFSKKNNKDQVILTLKADTMIPSSMEAILDVFTDVVGTKNWAPRVSHKETLKQISKTELIDLTIVELPWPIKDRYYITKQKFEVQPNGGILYNSESIDHPHKVKNAVLGKIHHSIFYINPSSKFETSSSFELNIDPAGKIPKWLSNMVQKKWPYDFYMGLNKELKRRSNQQKSAH